MNTVSTASHVFLMRCNIHHHNVRDNQKALADVKKVSGGKMITINSSVKAVLGMYGFDVVMMYFLSVL